jgi:hypothetical protein
MLDIFLLSLDWFGTAVFAVTGAHRLAQADGHHRLHAAGCGDKGGRLADQRVVSAGRFARLRRRLARRRCRY